ncbi:B12-binding domain-containing radical SAM protein [bacterium]|nr:B12-binding domain-containing radical SAM protein [bacterium]
MAENVRNLFLETINSLKQTKLWLKLRHTRTGYIIRKNVFKMLGINESFGLRDLSLRKDEPVLKMSYPGENDKRYSILFVQPPLPANRRHKRILPMGILYLASYIREKQPDINIGILDAQLQNLGYTEIMHTIIKHRWDCICFSYWTVMKQKVKNLSKATKQHCPDVTIIHGGTHPTSVPEDALETADYCCISEGEHTLDELLRYLRKAKKTKKELTEIKGIAFKDKGKIVKTPLRDLIPDLDTLPFPAYDLIPLEMYKMPLHVTGKERVPIIGSRGCPYNCSFCAAPFHWRRKVRFRSAENIIAEMKWVKEKYCIDSFHFWDDNFTINQKHTESLCKKIIDEKLCVEWVCLDRAEHIVKAEKLLPLLKESGCIGVETGLESANPDTFRHIHKDQAIDASEKAIKSLNNAGICPLYTCMAFNPGETIVGYYYQKDFLDKAQTGHDWYAYFHPFPFPLYVGQFATAYPNTKFLEEIKDLSLHLLEEPEDRYHHEINTIPYSLLNDVPLRTIECLDEDHYILWLYAVWTAFWTRFPGHDTREELADKLADAHKFLYPFFRKCDGSLTLHQIALHLTHHLNYTFHKSVRYAAFATYIFAQLGIIRSGLYHLDLKLEQKCVDIPSGKRAEIIEVLSLAGIRHKDIAPK